MLEISRGVVQFCRGLLRMPRYVHVWLFLLASVNIVPALLWLDHYVSYVVLATFVVNIALMIGLTARFGFSRILGLGHFPWFALNAYLLFQLQHLQVPEMRLWIVTLVTLNTVSLVIDTVDVLRWIQGDRRALVEGLD